MKNYDLLEKIGDGTYGIVWKAKEKSCGDFVAVKQLKKPCKDFKELYNLHEVKSLHFLNQKKCNNIAKLKNVIRETNGTTYLILDFSEQCLRTLIENNERCRVLFEEDTIKKIIYQVCLGVNFIHKMGFFHRDIKPDNILINDAGIIKITDFGFATKNRNFNFKDFPSIKLTPKVIKKGFNAKVFNFNFEENEKINDTAENSNNDNLNSKDNNSNISPNDEMQTFSDPEFHEKIENSITEKRDTNDNNFTEEKDKENNHKRKNDKLTDYMCTRYYRPPECLFKGDKYGIEIDIWAIGTLIAEMYLSKPLFETDNDQELFNMFSQILGTPLKTDFSEGYEKLEKLGIKPKSYERSSLYNYIPNLTEEAEDLLNKILEWNPSKRLNISQILKHKYFNDIRDRRIYCNLGLSDRHKQRRKTQMGISPNKIKKIKEKIEENKDTTKDSMKNDTSEYEKSDNNFEYVMSRKKFKIPQKFLDLNSKNNTVINTNNTNTNNEKELDLEELKRNFLNKSEKQNYNQKKSVKLIKPKNASGKILFNNNNNEKKFKENNINIPYMPPKNEAAKNFADNNLSQNLKILNEMNNINMIKDNKVLNSTENFPSKFENKKKENLNFDVINIKQDFKLDNNSTKIKNTKEIEQMNLKQIMNMKGNSNDFNINMKSNSNANDFNINMNLNNNFEFEFKENVIITRKKSSNIDEKSSNNENGNVKIDEEEYLISNNIPNLKKNKFNVNISNTKSPRFIPLKVSRPIEAYKGNFLNDFHKNFLYANKNNYLNSNKEKDRRFIDSIKNSVNSPINYDISSLNKFSNFEKDKTSSYKVSELLPMINSPNSNLNTFEYENINKTDSRRGSIERKIILNNFIYYLK